MFDICSLRLVGQLFDKQINKQWILHQYAPLSGPHHAEQRAAGGAQTKAGLQQEEKTLQRSGEPAHRSSKCCGEILSSQVCLPTATAQGRIFHPLLIFLFSFLKIMVFDFIVFLFAFPCFWYIPYYLMTKTPRILRVTFNFRFKFNAHVKSIVTRDSLYQHPHGHCWCELGSAIEAQL